MATKPVKKKAKTTIAKLGMATRGRGWKGTQQGHLAVPEGRGEVDREEPARGACVRLAALRERGLHRLHVAAHGGAEPRAERGEGSEGRLAKSVQKIAEV